MSATPAVAGGPFDGTFIETQPGAVAYFELTQTGSQVQGFFYLAKSDQNAPGGLVEHRLSLFGVADGSQVTFSNMVGWVARASWGGFTLTYPAKAGYLLQERFRSASINDVNSAMSSLHQTADDAQANRAYAQQQGNAQNDLTDSENRLNHDLNLRPMRLLAIMNAKADVSRVQARIKAVNDEIAAREARVTQAQQDADNAKATAQTGTELAQVGTLQSVVGLREGDVGVARGVLGAANGELAVAEARLDYARRDLANLDARIAQLKQFIARDKSILGVP